MKNLWIIVGPILAVAVIGIIAIIVLVIKKPKTYKSTSIGIAVLIVLLLAVGMPKYFQDLFEKNTETFTGVYIDVQVGGTVSGTNRNLFDVDGKQEKVYIPRIIWQKYNLIAGKTYKVEYFVNTRILCSIELVDT